MQVGSYIILMLVEYIFSFSLNTILEFDFTFLFDPYLKFYIPGLHILLPTMKTTLCLAKNVFCYL